MKPSLLTLLILLAAPAALAQSATSGGGVYPMPEEAPLSTEQRADILAQLQRNREALRAAGILEATPRSSTALGWPLRAADGLSDYGYHGVSNFVDQDPDFGELGDYSCGARTYDVPGYNHSGTDYFTWPYAWAKMDDDAVEVVAAAPGVILLKSDGLPDRSCTLNGTQWNAVYVEGGRGARRGRGVPRRCREFGQLDGAPPSLRGLRRRRRPHRPLRGRMQRAQRDDVVGRAAALLRLGHQRDHDAQRCSVLPDVPEHPRCRAGAGRLRPR